MRPNRVAGPPPARRTAARVASLSLALAGLVLALVYIGPGRVGATLRGALLAYVALAALAYATFFLLRGVRWRLLLQDHAPSAGVAATTSLTALGWMVSTFVPMKAGDVTRAVLMSRRERAGLAGVVGTIAVERALDVMGLALAASGALLALPLLGPTHLPAMAARALAVAWVLPLLALLALFWMARWVPARRRTNAVTRFAGAFLDAVRDLVGRPRLLAPVALLTVLACGAQILVFLLLIVALLPQMPVLLAAAGVPLFLLSFVVALVPGHVGTYEAAFVVVYAALGFDASTLLPVAVSMHLLTASIVTLLGAVGFALFRWTAHALPRPTPRMEAKA